MLGVGHVSHQPLGTIISETNNNTGYTNIIKRVQFASSCLPVQQCEVSRQAQPILNQLNKLKEFYWENVQPCLDLQLYANVLTSRKGTGGMEFVMISLP